MNKQRSTTTNISNPRGEARVEIHRVDGTIEVKTITNTPIAAGLNKLASRAISNTESLFNWIAIGKSTQTASLGSNDIDEIARSECFTTVNSRQAMIFISSFSGYTDEITSNQIESAGVINHPTSGSGEFLNILTGIGAVLGSSDYLNLGISITLGQGAIIVPPDPPEYEYVDGWDPNSGRVEIELMMGDDYDNYTGAPILTAGTGQDDVLYISGSGTLVTNDGTNEAGLAPQWSSGDILGVIIEYANTAREFTCLVNNSGYFAIAGDYAGTYGGNGQLLVEDSTAQNPYTIYEVGAS